MTLRTACHSKRPNHNVRWCSSNLVRIIYDAVVIPTSAAIFPTHTKQIKSMGPPSHSFHPHWIVCAILCSSFTMSLAAQSSQPPPKFLTRHPDSVFDYQKLPKGVYLPEDDNPGADKFTFSGCKGTAYLTFDIDYTTGGVPDWHRRRLTTELLCKCKEILYQDSPENDPIVPSEFTQIPLSLCIVSAQRKGKICDCELPRKLLPVIGQYTSNQHVESVDNIDKRLVVSESGQQDQSVSSGAIIKSRHFVTVPSCAAVLFYLW